MSRICPAVPRIVRLTASSTMVSAQAFEQAFAHLAPYVDLEVADANRVFDAIFGPPGEPYDERRAAERIPSLLLDADYVCFDFESLQLASLLFAMRNRAGFRLRFLVIAHSPGAFLLDWALLRLLLRPGDRIVAPTERSRAIIELVCPELRPWIRVVPHPTVAHCDVEARRSGFVYLGRIVEGKLLHRVLDAMAMLSSAFPDARLDIVGPWAHGESRASAYFRSLVARRDRLELTDTVSFVGPVSGAGRTRVHARAAAFVNLSVSLEESFGKSVAEGLACGVPSLVTDWDGLPEVAGPCGLTVAVHPRSLAMDVDPATVAEAMCRVLERPAGAADCRESARRFHPETVGPRYRELLEEGGQERDDRGVVADCGPDCDEPAAPLKGLLATAAPLTGYTWRELYATVAGDLDEARAVLAGQPRGALGEAGELRTRLIFGLKRSLEFAFANIAPEAPRPVTPAPVPRTPAPGFAERLQRAVVSASNLASRVVCLELLWSMGAHDFVRSELDQLRQLNFARPGNRYLEVEALVAAGDADAAVELCLSPTDPGWWDEHAVGRLCQLASVALHAGRAERAMSCLRTWTDCYPDAPGAHDVWLARAACAGELGLFAEVADCLRHACHLVDEDSLAVVTAALLARAEW